MESESELMTHESELFLQGVENARLGDYAGARQAFNRVLQLHPDDANAYGHRCVVRHRMGDQEGAIADCQQAAALYLAQGKMKEHQYALKMRQTLQP